MLFLEVVTSGQLQCSLSFQSVILTPQMRSQIIDDDIDLNSMRVLNDDEVDIYQLDEEGPQIAGIIDERPAEIRAQEYYNDRKRWKVFAPDDDGDIKVIDQQINKSKVSNAKDITELSKEVFSATKQKADNFDNMLYKNKPREKSKSDQSSQRQLSKYNSKSKQNDSDSDFSPTRKLSSKNSANKIKDSKNSEKSKHSINKSGSDSDLSPQRASKLDSKDSKYYSNRKDNTSKSRDSHRDRTSNDSVLSPPKKSYSERKYSDKSTRKNDSDSDTSPPQNEWKNSHKSVRRSDNDSDLSPSRKSQSERKILHKSRRRNESNSDLSPPRKSNSERKNSDKSKRRNESDSDLSPPRKSNDSERYFENRSRPNKMSSRNIESDSDLSPDRKKSKGERYENLEDKYHSNKRRVRRSLSNSPLRNSKRFSNRHGYNKNHSTPPPSKSHKHSRVKEEKSDSDLSPPRGKSHRKNSDSLNSKMSSDSFEQTKKSKMEKTLDGKRAGLQDAQHLKRELADFKNKEDQLFAKMNASVSGEGAAPVIRDRKTGKIRNLDEERVIDKEKSAKDEARKEKYSRWGRGLKQVEDASERLADAMKEMNKPLARYADDKDLDNFLKAQEREGDPMLDYIKRKQGEAIALTGNKPKYQGSYMPNRFGIRPGHRWDGVDRSNGYEKKWFSQQNARTARDEEAYKWSTSDM